MFTFEFEGSQEHAADFVKLLNEIVPEAQAKCAFSEVENLTVIEMANDSEVILRAGMALQSYHMAVQYQKGTPNVFLTTVEKERLHTSVEKDAELNESLLQDERYNKVPRFNSKWKAEIKESNILLAKLK